MVPLQISFMVVDNKDSFQVSQAFLVYFSGTLDRRFLLFFHEFIPGDCLWLEGHMHFFDDCLNLKRYDLQKSFCHFLCSLVFLAQHSWFSQDSRYKVFFQPFKFDTNDCFLNFDIINSSLWSKVCPYARE